MQMATSKTTSWLYLQAAPTNFTRVQQQVAISFLRFELLQNWRTSKQFLLSCLFRMFHKTFSKIPYKPQGIKASNVAWFSFIHYIFLLLLLLVTIDATTLLIFIRCNHKMNTTKIVLSPKEQFALSYFNCVLAQLSSLAFSFFPCEWTFS